MTDPLTDIMSARRAAVVRAREVISALAPGAAVGHANPELDWEGVIEADRRGRWAGTDEVRVRWTAGTDGSGAPLAGSEPGWVAATAVNVKGRCPDCHRPAHYVSPANPYGTAGGWHQDARIDPDPCRPYTQDEPGGCWATRGGQREVHDLRWCEHFLPVAPPDAEVGWIRDSPGMPG